MNITDTRWSLVSSMPCGNKAIRINSSTYTIAQISCLATIIHYMCNIVYLSQIIKNEICFLYYKKNYQTKMYVKFQISFSAVHHFKLSAKDLQLWFFSLWRGLCVCLYVVLSICEWFILHLFMSMDVVYICRVFCFLIFILYWRVDVCLFFKYYGNAYLSILFRLAIQLF